jgi:hypothetical protein
MVATSFGILAPTLATLEKMLIQELTEATGLESKL